MKTFDIALRQYQKKQLRRNIKFNRVTLARGRTDVYLARYAAKRKKYWEGVRKHWSKFFK